MPGRYSVALVVLFLDSFLLAPASSSSSLDWLTYMDTSCVAIIRALLVDKLLHAGPRGYLSCMVVIIERTPRRRRALESHDPCKYIASRQAVDTNTFSPQRAWRRTHEEDKKIWELHSQSLFPSARLCHRQQFTNVGVF